MDGLRRQMDNIMGKIEGARTTSHKGLNIGSLRICTITAGSKTSGGYIDIEGLKDKLSSSDVLEYISEQFKAEIKVNDMKNFYNCVTLKCIYTKSKRAIKVFRNGSLHITGCTTLEDVEHTVEKMKGILLWMGMGGVETEGIDIQLINTCIKLGGNINMLGLREVIHRETNYGVYYDIERHPGLQVKVLCEGTGRVITVIVFRTGSILITGIKEPRELEHAYMEIMGVIERNKDVIIAEDVEPLKKRQRKTKEFDYGEFL